MRQIPGLQGRLIVNQKGTELEQPHMVSKPSAKCTMEDWIHPF